MLESTQAVCESAMRLMGAIRLLQIGGATGATRGACSSLYAELQDGAWRNASEVSAAFPLATWEGDRLVITLDGEHCAAVAFGYESGMVLIEFAGLHTARPRPLQRRRKGSK